MGNLESLLSQSGLGSHVKETQNMAKNWKMRKRTEGGHKGDKERGLEGC